MSETLASRIGRLISGSVNAVIDAIENKAPDMVLQEAIREIDRAIDDVRIELGRCIANKHMSSQRLAQLNARHTDLAGQIETAVSQQRDDLARAGIAAQLDIEVQMPVLEKGIADEAAREREFEGYISALQAKKRDMAEEARLLREARAQPSSSPAPGQLPVEHGGAGARAEKAVAAFDRIAASQAGLPASGRVNLGDAQKIQELEVLNRNNRIEERLVALKQK